MTQATQQRKRSFSSFSYKDAFKYLGVTELHPWAIAAAPVPISDFFQQRLDRLKRFDLESFEVSKTLLIDAICEAGLEGFERLKIWKGAYVEGETICGNVDYLVAERRAYLEAPFVCVIVTVHSPSGEELAGVARNSPLLRECEWLPVIQTKNDDFEQGVAQCLVAMQACQWENQQLDHAIDIYGIVTNGEGWKFYKLTTAGMVYESLLHGIGEMSILLGILRAFFRFCEQNLQ